jgi:hypothetical protein
LPQIGFRLQKNSINVKLFSIGVEYDTYNIIGEASMFSLYFKKKLDFLKKLANILHRRYFLLSLSVALNSVFVAKSFCLPSVALGEGGRLFCDFSPNYLKINDLSSFLPVYNAAL